MSWALEWSYVAEHRDLFELNYRAAERICEALMQFTETGRGPVMRVEAGNPFRFVLRVKGAEAEIFVDMKARVIHVVRLYRRA